MVFLTDFRWATASQLVFSDGSTRLSSARGNAEPEAGSPDNFRDIHTYIIEITESKAMFTPNMVETLGESARTLLPWLPFRIGESI